MGIKTELFDTEKLEVTYEIIPAVDSETFAKSSVANKRFELQENMLQLDQEIDFLEEKISKLNVDIDKLTNHADGIDYATAVMCGLLTGIIDSIFVGEWDFKKAKAKANEDVNNKVIEFAKKNPKYKEWCSKNGKDSNRLTSAVQFLENTYKLPGDGAYKDLGNMGITNSTHHLDDFCHHPTLVGLICSIIVQFTGSAKYHGSNGMTTKIPVTVNEYGNFVSKNTWGRVFSGIINWFLTVAKTIQNQKGHLMSDMAGSLSSAKGGHGGAGIPGSFLSTLKELSSLPCFKDTNFAENLRKAYQNGIGTKNGIDLGAFNALFEGASSKFDMRTEMAVKSELKRQAFPVVLNEILVRALYFIRRFIKEMKEKESFAEIEWKNIIPIGNRTIERMMTIATGTFTSVDLADAAIRSAIDPKTVDLATFAKNMILRVNFVGIGRFAISIFVDVGMGIKRGKLCNERIQVMNKQLNLLNAKVFYSIADFDCAMVEVFEEQEKMWYAAESTAATLEEAYKTTEQAIVMYCNEMDLINKCMKNISISAEGVAKYNPDVLNNTVEILKWGNKK